MVKPGADPTAIVVAETLAETGVHISVRQLLGERLHPKLHAHCSYWLCDRQGGKTENRDPREHLAVEWVLRGHVMDRYIPRGDIFPPVLIALTNDHTAGLPTAADQQPTVVHAIIVQDGRVLMIRRVKRQGGLDGPSPRASRRPARTSRAPPFARRSRRSGWSCCPPRI
jgi:hypothetical protein